MIRKRKTKRKTKRNRKNRIKRKHSGGNKPDINIYLLCYNESVLMPHVVNFYKKNLPSSKITIYDNESSDNSVEIAKSLGCNVISFNTDNIYNEFKNMELKNNVWKDVKSGWIIVGDLDELIYVTEDELNNEMNLGTTILQTKGMDMIGESQTTDVSDIDIQEIKKYVYNDESSKKICFLREAITEINYGPGAHLCEPVGTIKESSKVYIIKHMNFLGLNYLINKYTDRFERTKKMRNTHGFGVQYINDVEKIKEKYNHQLNVSQILNS